MESIKVLDMCPLTPYSRKERMNSASRSTPTNEDLCTPIAGHEKLVLGLNRVKISENTASSYVTKSLEFGAKSEAILEEISAPDDGCMTPLCVGRLLETCPGAPIKSAAVTSRTIDASECRELEF
uniref:unknown protein 1-like n=1 Tax=Erigeron canadensis TaxID=72917 RepID=UPI001CB88C1A|nr:unknown protein 1-like [Erigeron canadensis]